MDEDRLRQEIQAATARLETQGALRIDEMSGRIDEDDGTFYRWSVQRTSCKVTCYVAGFGPVFSFEVFPFARDDGKAIAEVSSAWQRVLQVESLIEKVAGFAPFAKQLAGNAPGKIEGCGHCGGVLAESRDATGMVLGRRCTACGAEDE